MATKPRLTLQLDSQLWNSDDRITILARRQSKDVWRHVPAGQIAVDESAAVRSEFAQARVAIKPGMITCLCLVDCIDVKFGECAKVRPPLRRKPAWRR